MRHNLYNGVLVIALKYVSKHLGILHGAGMVTRSKHGNHVRYAIADEGVFELCEQVCGGVRRQLGELEALFQPVPRT